MAREWYFVENGQQRGPVPTDELRVMVRTGRLRGQDLVWNETMTEWTPVGQLPDLAPAAPTPSRPGFPTPMPAPAPAHYPSQGERYAAPVPAAPAGPVLAYQTAGGMDAPVSPRSLEMLRQTKPWVRFFSILSFIAAGLMALGGLFMLLAGLGAGSGRGAGVGGVFLLVYGGLACLNVIPAIFLGRYASRIGDLLQTRRSSDLEAALEAQKSFWRFVGIATLVLIGLYVVAILIAVVGAMIFAASRH